jgi:hypothetical protein
MVSPFAMCHSNGYHEKARKKHAIGMAALQHVVGGGGMPIPHTHATP